MPTLQVQLVAASGNAGDYILTFIPYQLEPVEVENGRGYAEIELPLKGTDEVVAQIAVRRTAYPGNTVAQGSVRLHWTDASQTTIATRQTDGSLYDCKITEDGGAKLTITLV
ncbi:hypothetical protein ABZW03_28170 [Kitasatospora sp. NPDC004799]|uniref:hypothetical protein n=1 Tax=Kitasatospora sp. NPDC004799 TaxID=3154460 RepID=UPI0033AE082B